MMDVGRHPNIDLLTNSRVIEASGEAGDFRVKVLYGTFYLWFSLHGVPPFVNDLTLYHEADQVGKSFRATPSRLYQL